jgi:DNA excision repair protein ERCC-4
VSKDPLPVVAIDSREQLPWSFAGLETVTKKLDQGDYSVVGLESRLAIERKSVADLVGSLSSGRERFVREMDRLAGYERAVIIVEGTIDELIAGLYRSKLRPSSVVGSIGSIFARWGVPTITCGSRENAEVIARAILVKCAKHLGPKTEAA